MDHDLAPEDRELWAIYIWWSCVLVLKMNALTWFTGRIRLARQVIHSEEDRVWMKGPDIILCPTGGGHEDVDRIRGAHRHDLETVLPFLLIAPLWLCASPLFPVARTILPSFAITSVLRTLVQMKIVNAPRCCETVLFVVELCILIFVSTVSTIHYANQLWFED
ncbi:prostaglandin E synthase [Ptiloglossa arizonensis]|uniref:prostaglandin E synthase n=1 Tax=Ptiloglossa arizonensis TaxID=3350558 RepID=UPI003F9F84AB